MEYQTPVSKLLYWERTKPDIVYLRQPINGIWHTWTWKQTAGEVRQLAGAILSLGLPAGSHIALLSKNCAHWMICDLAIMMAGHVSVPLYPNMQQQNVHQILTDSESVVLFAGKPDSWDDIKNGVPDFIKCISLPFCENDRKKICRILFRMV